MVADKAADKAASGGIPTAVAVAGNRTTSNPGTFFRAGAIQKRLHYTLYRFSVRLQTLALAEISSCQTRSSAGFVERLGRRLMARSLRKACQAYQTWSMEQGGKMRAWQDRLRRVCHRCDLRDLLCHLIPRLSSLDVVTAVMLPPLLHAAGKRCWLKRSS